MIAKHLPQCPPINPYHLHQLHLPLSRANPHPPHRSLGTPLGRQTIEVKVCKCPHRDARTDSERRRRSADEREPARPPKRRLEPAREVTEPAARRPRSAGRLVIEVGGGSGPEGSQPPSVG